MRPSASCTLPTCLCARPFFARTNTSHSGHSLLIASLRRRAYAPLYCMRRGCIAHPSAVFPRLHTRAHALLGERTFAAHDRIEFLPVDFAEIIGAARLVP